MPPQAIYFDLGNVLLRFSHERMCRQIADVAGLSAEAVRNAIFDETSRAVSPRLPAKSATQAEVALDQPRLRSAQWLYEVGLLDTDGYYAHFCEQTGSQPDRQRLENAACDIFWPIDEMGELVRRLAAAGNRLGVLSNINTLHWNFVADGRFPLLDGAGRPGSPFQWAVLSFEAAAMKPDRAIYDIAVGRTGAAAGEVMFIDDRPENVDGAKAAGLDAVEFVGLEKLTADLRERGVRGA